MSSYFLAADLPKEDFDKLMTGIDLQGFQHLGIYKNNPKKMKGIDNFDAIYTHLRFGYVLFSTFWKEEEDEIEEAFAVAFESLDKLSDTWVRLKRRVLTGCHIQNITDALEITRTFQANSVRSDLVFAYDNLCNTELKRAA